MAPFSETLKRRASIARRRRGLLDERGAITKAAIKGAIDPETSREPLDQNRAEDDGLAQREAELGRPLPDVERSVPVAQRVIADPGGLWNEARGEAARGHG